MIYDENIYYLIYSQSKEKNPFLALTVSDAANKSKLHFCSPSLNRHLQMSAPPAKKRTKHLVRYAHWSLEERYIRKINAALIHAWRVSYSQQLVSFCPEAGNEETSRLCRERGRTKPRTLQRHMSA